MNWISNYRASRRIRREEKLRSHTEQVAHELYQNRMLSGQPGDQNSDWATAEQIVRSPLKTTLFASNRPLIKLEKRIIEPTSRHLKNSALFDIVDRLSPALEAAGVLLIPVVLYWASQSFEQQRQAQEIERLQQETVQNYIAQLSEIFLNVDGDLRDDENQRIRTIATAATITLLRDPNLDRYRKGQVIEFLSQMDLVQSTPPESGEEEAEPIIISLSGASLSGADLIGASLIGASLSGAFLGGASLSGADLSDANLSGAFLRGAFLGGASLSGAVLSDADLSNADLFRADLRGAVLIRANLRGASLIGASLIGADLYGAFLSGAVLSDANLSEAFLYGADLSGAVLRGAFLSGASLSGAVLSGAVLSDADLSGAFLGGASLSGADLSGAFLLITDLRTTRGLSEQQLSAPDAPLICNSPLPDHINIAGGKDRDCDAMAPALFKRYPGMFKSLEAAQEFVNDQRQKTFE